MCTKEWPSEMADFLAAMRNFSLSREGQTSVVEDG
jgi:hypothetical protein